MLPLKPPLILSAVYSTGTGLLTLTFDHPLKAGTSHVGNWFVREANNRRTPLAPLVISDFTVTGTLGLPLLDLGADVVNYNPPPFDVVGLNGLRLEDFGDFPLTVVP